LHHAVGSDDDIWAQSAGSNPSALICSAFGFTLPPTAVVEGIEVLVRSSVVGAYVGTALIGARLTKDGTNPVGVERTGVFTAYPPDVNVLLGSPTDLWGTTWTVAEIQASGFGALIKLGTGSTSVSNYQVDQVQINVYYSDSGASAGVVSSSGQIVYLPGIGIESPAGGSFKES
jgi:hypothetical protein